MSELTDPAKELLEICRSLSSRSNKPGDVFLSEKFDVSAWSPEFFNIVFSITERAEYLKRFAAGSDMDEIYKSRINRDLDCIISAFNKDSMNSAWSSGGAERVGDSYTGSLIAISERIRQIVHFTKLSEEEIEEISEVIDTLLNWLEAHQLEDADFIRESIIVGLKAFKFRLHRLEWLGWGYTVEAMKEIVGAYLALERKVGPDHSYPQTEAMLKKLNAAFEQIFSKMKFAKDVVGISDMCVRVYGYSQLAAPIVRGLLPGPSA